MTVARAGPAQFGVIRVLIMVAAAAASVPMPVPVYGAMTVSVVAVAAAAVAAGAGVAPKSDRMVLVMVLESVPTSILKQVNHILKSWKNFTKVSYLIVYVLIKEDLYFFS